MVATKEIPWWLCWEKEKFSIVVFRIIHSLMVNKDRKLRVPTILGAHGSLYSPLSCIPLWLVWNPPLCSCELRVYICIYYFLVVHFKKSVKLHVSAQFSLSVHSLWVRRTHWNKQVKKAGTKLCLVVSKHKRQMGG